MLELNKIYNMDCLEGMKQLEDKSIDLCLTDFPYGVNETYDCFDDTQENLKELISKVMPEILRISKRALITCGNSNQYLFPIPDWTLSWIITSGNGFGKWGFLCWQPILAYGKDPYLENCLGARPDIFLSNEISIKCNHPCPKPINLWYDILLRGSVKETDIVLDPFMGSGTTAIVCIKAKRRFVGFEISKEYCDLANERINEARQQKNIIGWFE